METKVTIGFEFVNWKLKSPQCLYPLCTCKALDCMDHVLPTTSSCA